MSLQAPDMSDLQQCRGQGQPLQRENEELRRQLAAAQARLAALEKRANQGLVSQTKDAAASHPGWAGSQHSLSSSQISRYSRHLLLPSFGVAGRSTMLRSCALAMEMQRSVHSPHCVRCRSGAPVQLLCPRHWGRRPGITCCSISGCCRYALSVPFLSWQFSGMLTSWICYIDVNCSHCTWNFKGHLLCVQQARQHTLSALERDGGDVCPLLCMSAV